MPDLYSGSLHMGDVGCESLSAVQLPQWRFAAHVASVAVRKHVLFLPFF